MLTRIPALAAVIALSLTACSDDADDQDTGVDAAATETTSEGTTSEGTTAEGACDYTPAGPAPAKEVTPPPAEPSVEGTVKAVIETSQGAIPVTLDADAAPCAVGSFVSLAEQHYFDRTDCHRLVVGFVLQCGDPTATGTGGPGYAFPDELSGDETYTRGTLAMANSGPDTNGSQFFIVTQDARLDPLYTVFGSVSAKGMKVVDAVEAEGNASDGVAPAQQVTVTDVAVR